MIAPAILCDSADDTEHAATVTFRVTSAEWDTGYRGGVIVDAVTCPSRPELDDRGDVADAAADALNDGGLDDGELVVVFGEPATRGAFNDSVGGVFA